MPQIVSANRLADGIVVFLNGHTWVERLDDAQVFDDMKQAASGLAIAESAARANEIVEITPFEVRQTARGLEPTHLRDKVRAAGPTVRRDLGKQAG